MASRRPLRPRLLRRLPGRTVRARLTLTYGTLFLVSGLVLLTITGLLWGGATKGPIRVSATVPFTILRIACVQPSPPITAKLPPTGLVRVCGAGGLLPGNVQLPPRIVAGRVRAVVTQLRGVETIEHRSDFHQFLLYAAIALAGMTMISIALGWLIAGRMLRPLRTITAAAQDISATNLHERLDLGGPEDELKELGDTFDELIARLERSFQSQRQFVANASHELRTPLATMRATLDVALAKPAPIPEQTVTLAERLHYELDRVDLLLEGFLALARAQTNPEHDGSPLALDDLVDAALAERAEVISEKAIDFNVERCPTALVIGNDTLLARMVQNVIDNAVIHNDRHGWVFVKTELAGANARLVVENGGAVIDDGSVADLVQPFRRVGAERTGTDRGMGLGLSIVAAVADAHGGRVELETVDGGGLRVSIDLPAAAHNLAGSPT